MLASPDNDNRRARAGAGTVVVIPGLASPAWTMLPCATWLRGAGYRVVTASYGRERVRDTAERLRRGMPASGGPIHFVGHSLGGLVALALAEAMPRDWEGRVVAIGTPLNGSGLASRFTLPIELAFGPAAFDLLPGHRLAAQARVRPGVEVGMIAGEIPGSRLLGMPTDGAVPVGETRAALLADHVVVPGSHASLLVSADVARRVVEFLRNGRFDGRNSSRTSEEFREFPGNSRNSRNSP